MLITELESGIFLIPLTCPLGWELAPEQLSSKQWNPGGEKRQLEGGGSDLHLFSMDGRRGLILFYWAFPWKEILFKQYFIYY